MNLSIKDGIETVDNESSRVGHWLIDFIDQSICENVVMPNHYQILVEQLSPAEVEGAQAIAKIFVTIFFNIKEHVECTIAKRVVLFSNYLAQQNFNSHFFKFENSEEGTPVNTLYDLIDSTITYCIKNRLLFKKCNYCGRYFLAVNKTMVYCRRRVSGSTKSCYNGGRLRIYKRKMKKNPAMNVFYKKYKYMEHLTRKGRMTREEFSLLSKKIREQRDLCLSGELSQEDFEEWIKTAN